MLKIDSNPNLAPLLIAARRAAYSELYVIAADRGIIVEGDSEAEYDGCGRISINGVDLRPMIDAVVIETMVQTHPVAAKPRAWWRIWS